MVSIDVGLLGEPRVVTGPRPADGTDSLPPLRREKGKHEQALHVLLEGELSYDLANAILHEKHRRKAHSSRRTLDHDS